MLLPVACPICAVAGSAPCAACAQTIDRSGPVASPAGVDQVVAAMVYSGNARRLIVALKYHNLRSVVPWLAACLADEIRNELLSERFDAVTWIPASSAQQRRRGFDQGRVLAVALGHELGLRPRRLLRRIGRQRQTGADRMHRLVGPNLAVRNQAQLKRTPRVLIVDDVITTGASISRAALLLREAGASSVIAAVAASTPSS